MGLEQPLELARRHAGEVGERRARGGLLDLALHALEHPQQARMRHAEALAQGHALRPAAEPHLRMQEPIAHRGREAVAVVGLDQRMHHVERRDAAGAGQPLAVDFIQGVRDGKVRELLRRAPECAPSGG